MANSLLLDTLHERLQTAAKYDASVREHMTSGDPVHIRNTGKAISSAYEHIRNVAEYADEHLVLQRSIRRFYKRTLFIVKYRPDHIGHELIAELTLAGYSPDGRYSSTAAGTISKLATDYMAIYERLRQAHVSAKQAQDWILAVLSVQTSDLLAPHTYDAAIASFVFDYFRDQLPRDRLIRIDKEKAIFDDALYIAVQQTLLKSDPDMVRTDLLRNHEQNGDNIDHFIVWNRHTDELYSASLTQRLKRILQKNIAPFHILRQLAASNDALSDIVKDKEQFMQAYTHQIHLEYQRTDKRLNNGVVKSIGFLLITKMAIGIALEVPFDHYAFGHIIWLPLSINLLFPPLYMASIRTGISIPSGANAAATEDFMRQLLFGDTLPVPVLPKRTDPYPFAARLLYTVLALIPFAITIAILHRLHFNPLQMVIFFIFFSTASFLGFRLSSMVRELKMTHQEVGLPAIIRDLFYLPFIMLGQWLSAKYSKINVVGEILDLVIELPLKTVLGIVRQSVRFLNEKHQELY